MVKSPIVYGVFPLQPLDITKSLWEYLRDLFRRLPTMKVSELSNLLPDRWKARQHTGG